MSTTKSKISKQIISVVLTLAMVISMVPMTSMKVLAAEGDGVQTILDISQGNITIGKDSVKGCDTNGGAVTTADVDGYCITGETSTYTVTVSGGTHKIILDDVTIDVSSTGVKDEYGDITSYGNGAFSVSGTAQANITLVDTNTLKSGSGKAGLSVASGASVSIDGDGSLTAEGKDGGAGIGADCEASSGKIMINGGYIKAVGTERNIFGSYECSYYAAGIGGCGAYSVGEITINGGTVIAAGSSSAADIGSGSQYVECSSSRDATISINGGNIKGDVGVGRTSTSNTATIQNSAGKDVSLVTVKILGIDEEKAVDGGIGFPENFGFDNVKTIGNELYFYLPADTELTSLTLENITYDNNGSNIFVNMSAIEKEPKLNIADGNIVLSVEGGVKYYTISNGEKMYYDGNVVIAGDGTETATANTISISAGEHEVTLDGVNINVSDNSGSGALSVSGTAKADITLVNVNTLKSGSGKAGLSVGSGASVTIDGDGSLTAEGKDGGAGIGADCEASSGKITINGGYIKAVGTDYSCESGYIYYAAGIGGYGVCSVGEITINGGTVIAEGSSEAADIGSGSRCDVWNNEQPYTSMDATISINGGNIKGDVGVGRTSASNTATIQNSNKENVFPVKVKVLGGEGKAVGGGIGFPENFGLDNVKTIGNELYFYLPADTELTSLTLENITYDNNGSNLFINMSAFGKDPELNIAKGNIVLSAEDGVKYYTISNGEKVYYDGNVVIAGDETATANTISISAGEHEVTLDGVNINVSDTSGSGALSVSGTAKADITLVKENTLNSGSGKAGLSVASEASVTIDGDGSLTANGNGGGAGIGADLNASSGKITINGGYIKAVGTYSSYSDDMSTSHYYTAGIGGCGSQSVGTITINGGTVIAEDGGSYAADIGSGLKHYIYRGEPTDYSADATIIINGGNIQGKVGVGESDSALTATIQNSAGKDVSPVTVKIWGIDEEKALDSGTGFPEYFGLDNVVTIGKQLYFYLPADTELTSLTLEKITYNNYGSNIFVEPSTIVKDPELNIADGNIVLSADNGVKYYTISNGDKVYYDGNVVIAGDGTETATANTISISAGEHEVTLDGVNIDVSSSTGVKDSYGRITSPGNGAFSVSGTAQADITLVNENILKSGSGKAGLSVASGASVTIDGDGSLTAEGKDGGAGIGADYDAPSGEITINGGYINATGTSYEYTVTDESYNVYNQFCAAGIGGCGEQSVGTITINGGTVIAKGSGNAASIGSGSQYYEDRVIDEEANFSANATIIINGGNIQGAVGVGTSDSARTATIQNSNGETVGLYSLTLDSVEDKTPVYSVYGISGYGFNGVKTIENMLYLYLPTAKPQLLDYIYVDGECYEVTEGTEGACTKHECTEVYSADDEKDTISATCEASGFDLGSIALYAYGSCEGTAMRLSYDGEPKPAYITLVDNKCEHNVFEGKEYDITYTQNETNLTEVPSKAGTYTASVTVGEETVSVEFTIYKADPQIGAVSAKLLVNPSDVNEAVLSREDETLPGTLELTDTELQYGTNTYHWKFTPEDTENYNTKEGTVDITVISAKYQVGTEEGKAFENTSGISISCKGTQTIKLDFGETADCLDKVQYYVSDKVLEDTSTIEDWQEYTEEFSLDTYGTYYIYVRLTDKAGNEAVTHSKGIVVSMDSTTETKEMEYAYKENNDKAVAISLNGNTVKEVKNGETVLTQDTDYTVTESGITLKAAYLDTLAIAETPYQLTISYVAYGAEACESSMSVADTTISLNVVKKSGDTVATIDKSYVYIKDNADTISLAELLPTDCGAVTYSTPETSGDVTYAVTPVVSDGILSYTVNSGKVDDTGSITVVASTQNYKEDITITVNVKLHDQLPVSLKEGTEVTLKSNSLTYGEALSKLEFNSAVFVNEEGIEVPGTLAWKDKTVIPNVGSEEAAWLFTPEDVTYASVEGKVTVVVKEAEATPTPTVTEGASATPTVTGGASATPTITGGASATPTVTGGATLTPTEGASATPTPTEGASATPTITEGATLTPTEGASATPTITEGATPTPTEGASATPTITEGATLTPTEGASATPAVTGGASATPTITEGATVTPTEGASATPAVTEGASAALTPTKGASATPTVTKVPTATPTATKQILLPKVSKKSAKTIKVSWNKISGADGYVVYAASSDKTKYTVAKTVKSGKTKSCTLTKIGGKKVADKNYKFKVKAYKVVDGKKQYIAASQVIYLAKTSKKYGNASSVSVKKSSVSLKVGKTSKISATVKVAGGKTQAPKCGAKIRYISSNKKVATVTSKGKIKAVGKGSCKIYVVAINGTYKTVKVKVK